MTRQATSDEQSVTKRLDVREDHYCIGCGRLNPHGLKLTFYADTDGSVWASWTPEREQQGFEGIAHGGMITTVLDEVMGWAVSNAGIWAVTARLNVSFRKPVEIGRPTIARAWILVDHGRKIDVEASLIREDDGTLLAEGTGVFVRVSEEIADRWQTRYLEGESPR